MYTLLFHEFSFHTLILCALFPYFCFLLCSDMSCSLGTQSLPLTKAELIWWQLNAWEKKSLFFEEKSFFLNHPSPSIHPPTHFPPFLSQNQSVLIYISECCIYILKIKYPQLGHELNPVSKGSDCGSREMYLYKSLSHSTSLYS